MALQRNVTSGFAATDVVEAHFTRVMRRRLVAGESKKVAEIDCTVTLVVRGADGTELDRYTAPVENTGASFAWITPAFLALAWTAYLAANGYIEVA